MTSTTKQFERQDERQDERHWAPWGKLHNGQSYEELRGE
jgi:hypothetical protein